MPTYTVHQVAAPTGVAPTTVAASSMAIQNIAAGGTSAQAPALVQATDSFPSAAVDISVSPLVWVALGLLGFFAYKKISAAKTETPAPIL